jgi:hypothetical protein
MAKKKAPKKVWRKSEPLMQHELDIIKECGSHITPQKEANYDTYYYKYFYPELRPFREVG